jgi:hypothetical protein
LQRKNTTAIVAFFALLFEFKHLRGTTALAAPLRIEEGRRQKERKEKEGTKMIALLVVLTFLAAVTVDHLTVREA